MRDEVRARQFPPRQWSRIGLIETWIMDPGTPEPQTVIALFALLRKHLVTGLTSGALK